MSLSGRPADVSFPISHVCDDDIGDQTRWHWWVKREWTGAGAWSWMERSGDKCSPRLMRAWWSLKKKPQKKFKPTLTFSTDYRNDLQLARGLLILLHVWPADGLPVIFLFELSSSVVSSVCWTSSSSSFAYFFSSPGSPKDSWTPALRVETCWW